MWGGKKSILVFRPCSIFFFLYWSNPQNNWDGNNFIILDVSTFIWTVTVGLNQWSVFMPPGVYWFWVGKQRGSEVVLPMRSGSSGCCGKQEKRDRLIRGCQRKIYNIIPFVLVGECNQKESWNRKLALIIIPVDRQLPGSKDQSEWPPSWWASPPGRWWWGLPRSHRPGPEETPQVWMK